MSSTIKKIVSTSTTIALMFAITTVTLFAEEDPAIIPVTPVISISLNATSKTLGVNENYTLLANADPNVHTETLTWDSTNKEIATVTPNGIVKAIKNGSTSITVKTTSGKNASCKITVKAAPKAITLKHKKYTLKKGKKLKLKPKLSKGSASNTLTYSSSKKRVATVDSNGTVTALKSGKTTITVKTYNNKKAKCSITVRSETENKAKKLANDLLKLINKERQKHKLPAYTTTTKLDSVALKRAKELSENYSHYRPNGKLGFSIIPDAKIPYNFIGENIGGNHHTAASIFKAWMNSETHKKNILNPNFKKIGIAYYYTNTSYKHFWAGLFLG